LCGAYNGSVIRQAFHLEREIIERGLVPKFYLVGNKVIQAFSRYSSSEVLGTSANISASPSSSDADLIAQTMSTAFLKGEIDSIDVLSTHFISMISSKVKLSPINPIHSVIDWKPDLLATSSKNLASLAKPALKPELLLEPDSVSLLDTLVPMYFSNRLYSLLLEASASELAARMTAMSNASNNAGEMIHNLTIKYNKARQAAITQEILEIVGGAEALK
jgi:F-type H+-transporting ATPase subunit gamma